MYMLLTANTCAMFCSGALSTYTLIKNTHTIACVCGLKGVPKVDVLNMQCYAQFVDAMCLMYTPLHTQQN